MFLLTEQLWKNEIFQQGKIYENFPDVFNKLYFHIPQPLWNFLQAGIDVGGDVPNVVLEGFVAAL